MNLRHAAALALTGWYLMIPPYGSVDSGESPPLADWTIQGVFDSRKACTEFQKSWRGLVSDMTPDNVGGLYKNMTNDMELRELQIRRLRDITARSRCLASNDPRLKGKHPTSSDDPAN